MKICQLILTRRKKFGGVERYAVDLTRALVERGHEVLAVAVRGTECEAMFQATPNLQQAALSPLRAFKIKKWHPFVAGKIERILTRFKPDVVQAQQLPAIYYGGKAAKKLGLPLVAHVHNDYVKLKYFRHVDLFIPPTATIHHYLRSQHIPAEKISLIPNFSALDAVERVKLRGGGGGGGENDRQSGSF